MAAAQESTAELEQYPTPGSGHRLKVVFVWKEWKAYISAHEDPIAHPEYICDFKVKTPKTEFIRASDKAIFGTGRAHLVSINSQCVVNGKEIELHAMKRFKTQYSSLSYAFSPTADPVVMTWETSSSFKLWNFICLDPKLEPVAKFSLNIFALRHFGNIEFMSDAPPSDAVKEEVVVTTVTLYYTMVLRMNNIFNLFGAIGTRPSKNVPTAPPAKTADGDDEPAGNASAFGRSSK